VSSTSAVGAEAPSAPTDHYTIISADCHGGGSPDQYREYLDARHRDAFDAWRSGYRNPYRDLQGDSRTRNWDDARRWRDLEKDGQVAEVLFPNTVPPFFPTGIVIARPPTAEEYELRWAGLRAHNRWLADFCAQAPNRRAGIAQVCLNDVDDAVREIHWAKEAGLRGVLIPNIPPDHPDLLPVYDPGYDPIWAACQDLDLPVNSHSGTGLPDYGKYPVSQVLWVIETPFFGHRVLWFMIMSGVFERFPRLKFVMTETGAGWVPQTLRQLDGLHMAVKAGRTGEVGFDSSTALALKPRLRRRRPVRAPPDPRGQRGGGLRLRSRAARPAGGRPRADRRRDQRTLRRRPRRGDEPLLLSALNG